MTPPASAGHASDEILALYALHRENVDAATVAHIAQCAQCQQEAAQFTSLLREVEDHLYRATCPPPETLTAHALHTLAPAEQREVEAHLQHCEYCAEEIRATHVFLERTASDLTAWIAPASSELSATEPANTPTTARPGEAVRRIIAQLLPSPSLLNPAFPVLGTVDEGGALHVFHAEDLIVTIQQEEAHGTHVVTGSIRHDAQDPSMPPSAPALLARLIHLGETGSRLVAESAITRDTFEFEEIRAGTYQIEVLFPDRLVVVAPIPVGDSAGDSSDGSS